MADQLFGFDVVSQKGEAWREVIVRYEMTGLRHCEEFEVIACPPVPPIDQVYFRGSGVLHPVNLAGLRPEVFATLEIETSEPRFLSLGSVLGVELTGVDEDGALSSDQLFDVAGVVIEIVHDESLTDSRRFHLKNGSLSALVNVDGFVDVCLSGFGLS